MNYQTLIGLAATVFIGTSVQAHEEQRNANWCPNGQIVELAQMDIRYALLKRFAEDAGACAVGPRSCGQFDDDYLAAFAAADHYCHGLRSASVVGELRATFNAPAAFKHRETHHQDYDIRAGLNFTCSVCVEIVRDTIPPEPIHEERQVRQ